MTQHETQTFKEKVQAQWTQLKSQPKMWGTALAISCLTLGFAGGMAVSGQTETRNDASQMAVEEWAGMEIQDGQDMHMPPMQDEQGMTPPDMDMQDQGGQDRRPPHMQGTPPDQAGSQEKSQGKTAKSSKNASNTDGQTTPPSQAKSKNQETKEKQDTENSFSE